MLRRLGIATCLCFAIGCDVGSVPGGAGDDSGSPDSRPAVGSPDATTTQQGVCKNTVVAVGNGNHNPGQDCISAGCHAAGGEGPTFTVAGTVYTDALGTAPQIGATITLRDSLGITLDLATQQNGNFYSTAQLTPPLTVYASECPSIMHMPTTTTGTCNTGGCHDGVAATGRIYLP
jgi:hypothetical protein